MNGRYSVLITLVLLFVGTLISSQTVQADTKAKVLFIGKNPDHPFGTHMYLHTCKMLAKCLEKHEGVETVISNGWPKDETVLKGVSTIVVYSTPAAEFLLDSPYRDQVIEKMDAGVGLVTLHWASSVNKNNFDRLGARWMSYLGGTWISNVGLHTGKSPLKQLVPDHPICRGWKEYELLDEYYLNPTITDEATPLLQVMAKDKPVVVGWAFNRKENKGRSFGTTLGHFYNNFQRKPFRKMVVNAILWTGHVKVPEEGANVELSDDELALPEKPEN